MKNIFRLLSIVLLSSLAVVGVVSAATTISTDISTGGQLTVNGTSTFMGYMGIGTTSPAVPLDITGQVNLHASSTNNSIYISNNGTVFQPQSGRQNDVIIGGSADMNGVRNGDTDLSVIIGSQAETFGSGNDYFQTIIGYGASVGIAQPKNVVIGALAMSSSSDAVIIGYNAKNFNYQGSNGGGDIVIGSNANASSSGDSIIIGYNSNLTGASDHSINIGNQSNVSGSFSASFGVNNAVSTDDTFLYGDNGRTTNHVFTGNVSVGTGVAPVASSLQVATSTTNATTTIEIGKSGQNKGSCLVMYDSTGAQKFVSIQNGTFVISSTSCR